MNCTRCDKPRTTTDEPDPCIGYLENVMQACCGHGDKDGHIVFDTRPGDYEYPDYSGTLRINLTRETQPETMLALHKAINEVWFPK